MRSLRILLTTALILFSFNSVFSQESVKETIYRISCGSTESYIDNDGNEWSADQGYSESKTALREASLNIHNTSATEVYRTERYGMESYTLPVEPGSYTIQLHFAETYDCNYDAGNRSFGVSINDEIVVDEFDPFTASGGFAVPSIIEYTGCSATNQIDIKFTEKAVICGIEIIKVEDNVPELIQQITLESEPDEFFIGIPRELEPDIDPLKILFIGNSMTFFWAIPESLEAMLEIGTNNMRIETQRSLYGGKWLEYHYNKTDAVELIKNGEFDFVVLQEGSGHPLEKPDLFFEFAEKFDSVILESGANTLLYPSPIHLKHTDADRRLVMDRFVELSNNIDAPIIPVCETIRLCYEEKPNTVWHNADGIHMGMHGGYAVACTFYAALTDGEVFPPPAILVQQVQIDPDLALFIQEKSKEAVETYFK